MGFPRQEYWNGLPFSSPGHLPHLGIEPGVGRSPGSWALFLGFPCGSAGEESTCNARDPGSTLGQEDPLEKEMATHSSILAWEIPWTEEPGELQSVGLQRIGHELATK